MFFHDEADVSSGQGKTQYYVIKNPVVFSVSWLSKITHKHIILHQLQDFRHREYQEIERFQEIMKQSGTGLLINHISHLF